MAGEGVWDWGGGGWGLEVFEPRRVALVVHDRVEEASHARVVERPQFGVHVAAAQHEPHAGRHAAHRLRDPECAEQRAGEGTRHADNLRLQIPQIRLDARFEHPVDRAPAAEPPEERTKVRQRHAQPFGIAGESEVGIDVVADPKRKLVHVRRHLHLRVGGEVRVLQDLDRLVHELVAVGAQHLQRDLDRKVALRTGIAPCGKKPHQRSRGGVGGVQLNKRRRQEQDHAPGGGVGAVGSATAVAAGVSAFASVTGASRDHSSNRCFCSTGLE